jgi:hypothetical protein
MSHDLDLETLCSIKVYRNLRWLRLAASERAAEREPFLGDLIRPGLAGDALELVCIEGGSGRLGGRDKAGQLTGGGRLRAAVLGWPPALTLAAVGSVSVCRQLSSRAAPHPGF